MAKFPSWIYTWGHLIKTKYEGTTVKDGTVYVTINCKVYPVWKYALFVIVLLLFYFIYTICY